MRFTGKINGWNLAKQAGEITTVSKQQKIIFRDIHFAQKLTRQPIPGERVTFTLAQDVISKRWKANKIRFVGKVEPECGPQRKLSLVSFIALCLILFCFGVVINLH